MLGRKKKKRLVRGYNAKFRTGVNFHWRLISIPVQNCDVHIRSNLEVILTQELVAKFALVPEAHFVLYLEYANICMQNVLGKQTYFEYSWQTNCEYKARIQLRHTFRKEGSESDIIVYKIQLSGMPKPVKEPFYFSTKWILTNKLWHVGPVFSKSERLSATFQCILKVFSWMWFNINSILYLKTRGRTCSPMTMSSGVVILTIALI